MGKILTGEYLPSSTDCNKLDECKSEPLVLDDIDAGVEGAVEDDKAVGDGGEDEEAGVPVQSLCQLSPCTLGSTRGKAGGAVGAGGVGRDGGDGGDGKAEDLEELDDMEALEKL